MKYVPNVNLLILSELSVPDSQYKGSHKRQHFAHSSGCVTLNTRCVIDGELKLDDEALFTTVTAWHTSPQAQAHHLQLGYNESDTMLVSDSLKFLKFSTHAPKTQNIFDTTNLYYLQTKYRIFNDNMINATRLSTHIGAIDREGLHGRQLSDEVRCTRNGVHCDVCI